VQKPKAILWRFLILKTPQSATKEFYATNGPHGPEIKTSFSRNNPKHMFSYMLSTVYL
jgi:hypothetical protein